MTLLAQPWWLAKLYSSELHASCNAEDKVKEGRGASPSEWCLRTEGLLPSSAKFWPI